QRLRPGGQIRNLAGFTFGGKYMDQCLALRAVATLVEQLTLELKCRDLRAGAGRLDAVDDLPRRKLTTSLTRQLLSEGGEQRWIHAGDLFSEIARQPRRPPLARGLPRKP